MSIACSSICRLSESPQASPRLANSLIFSGPPIPSGSARFARPVPLMPYKGELTAQGRLSRAYCPGDNFK